MTCCMDNLVLRRKKPKPKRVSLDKVEQGNGAGEKPHEDEDGDDDRPVRQISQVSGISVDLVTEKEHERRSLARASAATASQTSSAIPSTYGFTAAGVPSAV